MKSYTGLPLLILSFLVGDVSAEPLLTARLVTEETVATFLTPNNGAGPLWCGGAPLVFRDGANVFASVLETGEGVPPLCNTRWRLFVRKDGAWSLVRAAESFRIREPSPLGGIPGKGPVFLSINPSIEPPGTHYGRCTPELLLFDSGTLNVPPKSEIPVWDGEPYFTDHSYRGVAVDSGAGELLWMNIDAKTSILHWSLRKPDGSWSRQGGVTFPIRACYPQVALKNYSAHVMGIGDIVEPIEEWKNFKKDQTGNAWDYVFRRLFYAVTPDIDQEDFGVPLEVDSVESTGGHISNLDLWIGPAGEAHLLYLKSNINHLFMRDRYHPGLPVLRTLEYVVVKDGEVNKRETLCVHQENGAGTQVHYGRFHSTPDGQLWVVFVGHASEEKDAGPLLYLMPVSPVLDRKNLVSVRLEHPITTFFTNTERGGSLPSWTLDLFGLGAEANLLRYAQIELAPVPPEKGK